MEQATQTVTKLRKKTKVAIRTFEVSLMLISLLIGVLIVFVLNKLSYCPKDSLSGVGIMFNTIIPLAIGTGLTEAYIKCIKVKSRLLTKYGFQILTSKPSS